MALGLSPPKKAPAAAAARRPLAYYITPVLNVRNTFPVNRIKIDGHYLWPFLRSELSVNAMIANSQQPKDRKPFVSHQTQACTLAQLPYELRESYRQERGMKEVADLPERHIDFLFFVNVNSVDLNKTDSGFYNRLTDPIYREALKMGTAEKVEIIKTASEGIFKRNKYAYPTTAIVPNYISSSGHFNRAQYPHGLIGNLNKMIPYLSITHEQFGAWIDWQLHMVEFFKEIFAKYTPHVVFCHPYYYNAPMIFAARGMGIKVVEIQHGTMAGENNLSYDNWQEIPSDGYQALPDYFWVWGKSEYDRLREVFESDKPNRPQPIVGGYPWIEMSQEISSPDAIKLLDNELSRYPHKRKALVTLQMFATMPPVVRELIKRTRNDILWIVRHHPKTRGRLGQSELGSNVFTSKTVDEVLLVSLFDKVDFHFSETSSSIFEADYFGVYNYVCSAEGLTNYKHYIDANLAGYCTLANIEETVQEIRDGDSFEKQPRLNYISRVSLKEVLSRVLHGTTDTA